MICTRNVLTAARTLEKDVMSTEPCQRLSPYSSYGKHELLVAC
jgi:hypothetical protein